MASDLALPNHRACSACQLQQTRTNVVPGYGDPASPLVFVGEAPGADEDLAGKPFIGASGRLLRSVIDAMPLMQSDRYFYTNIHHCRPPGNKTENGRAAGWDICPRIWLTAELKSLNPTVIVACGKTACDYFRPGDTDMPMRWHAAKDSYDDGLKAWIVGMYHPSYALRLGGQDREQNIAIVSMAASLQRVMYYLVAAGIVSGKVEDVPEITTALEEGIL